MAQESSNDVNFIYRMMAERDPTKRRVKPAAKNIELLQLAGGEDSSDDSDFDISKHTGMQSNDSDIGDDSSDNIDEEASDSGSDDDSVEVKPMINIKKEPKDRIGAEDESSSRNTTEKLICSVCLGDISTENDEIVTCDSCGVTVHEGCYGISDSDTVVSTHSSCSTEPWFCDSCKAGVMNPVCEICPNSGGLFKETDVGRWVHIVCALYVQGVAFSSVEKLDKVTLFELKYNRWGQRTCTLCEDETMSRTGVCMKCDAGLCNTYFHATCAQRNGLLLEATTQEIADPFFANCSLHGDKNMIPRKKKNWQILQQRMMRIRQSSTDPKAQARIERKLEWFRDKYRAGHLLKLQPWVPTQKLPRMLSTSASACRKLKRKAALMEASGANTTAGPIPDIARRWYVPPAFSVEYIAYCLDRDKRIDDLKSTLQESLEAHDDALLEEEQFRKRYATAFAEQTKVRHDLDALKATASRFATILGDFGCKDVVLPDFCQEEQQLFDDQQAEEGGKRSDVISPTAQSPDARCKHCGRAEHIGTDTPPEHPKRLVKCSGASCGFFHFGCQAMTRVMGGRYYCPACETERQKINQRRRFRKDTEYKKRRRCVKKAVVSSKRR